VHVLLAQQHVGRSAELHLRAVLGVEQHAVAHLDLPHVLPHGDDGTPGQASADDGGRGDDDAGRRTALPGLAVERDEEAVVEHADGQLAAAGGGGAHATDATSHADVG